MEKYNVNEILINTSTGEKYVIVDTTPNSYVVRNHVSGHERMIYSGELEQYRYGGCAIKSGYWYVCTKTDTGDFVCGHTYMSDKDGFLICEKGVSDPASMESLQFRYWNISDAKPGDILKSYGYVFEVKDISNVLTSGELTTAKCIDSEGFSYPEMKFVCYGSVRPATYIERMLLEKRYMSTETAKPVPVQDKRNFFGRVFDFIKCMFS